MNLHEEEGYQYCENYLAIIVFKYQQILLQNQMTTQGIQRPQASRSGGPDKNKKEYICIYILDMSLVLPLVITSGWIIKFGIINWLYNNIDVIMWLAG